MFFYRTQRIIKVSKTADVPLDWTLNPPDTNGQMSLSFNRGNMGVESATSSPPDPFMLNWMLVDMNSYFASVEQHLRPELRGRRVAVIPVESENTCVIAASYDAKSFGVKVGTRVRDARQLCPGIVFIKARPDIYVTMHHAILRSVDKCLPIHKVYSIDEWAIRLLGEERKPQRAAALGQRIKQQLLGDFSPWLTCSIGIAPTRLLAKIACELRKPDGLTVLYPSELPDRLDHLSLDDLCGIGHGMLTRLNACGIQSVRDLWGINKQRAIQVWGSVAGGYWWTGFHGFDEPEMSTRRHSMSHANVLDPKFRNDESAYGIVVRLLCRLGARLRHDGYFAQHLQVYLKSVRGSYWCEQTTLPCVQDTPTLLKELQRLWRKRIPDADRPIKVGVAVTRLVPAAQVSLSLFDEMEKPRRASQAVDKINQRWGAATIYFGSMQEFRHPMDDKIAFGRIPPETR
ncbi:MAG: type VI secretion protein ImpB [Planctomycetota bacterium]|nr:type VI secretion protein ImpB [Planctomycetota bacterium]